MNEYALFDIVIPCLSTEMAHNTVSSLRETSYYPHNYILIHNGDSPTGYIEPCNRGYRAGNCDYICFVNDDVRVVSEGWDAKLHQVAQEGYHCFSPWTPEETNMRLNGWFICQSREYIDRYGWAFDPRFKCWCGDIDLIMRLEHDNVEHKYVQDIECTHEYSKTFSNPDWQEIFIPWQLTDLELFRDKWNADANEMKVVQRP